MSSFDYSNNRLFHFTTFNNAVKILALKKLRFGYFDKVNDILEVHREYFSDFGSDLVSSEIEKYSVLCFSADRPYPRIFTNNSLWGYYADRGNGVCLVLDKKKFDKSYLNFSSKVRNRTRKVKYIKNFYNTVFLKSDNPKDVANDVLKNIPGIFYTKSIDWKHENEIRYLSISQKHQSQFIDIADCINSIIICLPSVDKYISSPEYYVLKKLISEELIYRYTTEIGTEVLMQNDKQIWPQYDNFKIDV